MSGIKICHGLTNICKISQKNKRFWEHFRGYSKQTLSLNVEPKSGLVDDPFSIEIKGLEPYQFITLCSNLTNSNNKYGAIAHYVSDRNGNVNTESHPSVGGNYIGTESEGLLWSMKPLPGQGNVRRLIKYDVFIPHVVEIRAFSDHLNLNDAGKTNPISSASVERWYKSENVDRIKIREGQIRGMLFMPKGNGPFLPVIDMFGSIGKIIEFRAALLASRGFAVLSLPFFGYEDLPRKLTEIDLDYFEDAVHFMKNLAKVKSKGVGVYGVSKGGEIAHMMAEFLPDVRAVVSIGGCALQFDQPLVSKRRNLLRPSTDYANIIETNAPSNKDGSFSLGQSVTLERMKYMFKNYGTNIEKSDANFLIIQGDCDACVNPMLSVLTAKRLKDHGKENYELLLYPGAGHLIEPPFAPLARSSFVRTYADVTFNYGGETYLHAKAQHHSWLKIQEFFKKHLSL